MKFSIAVVGVDEEYPEIPGVYQVCDYLGAELSLRDYGPGVIELNMYISISQSSETGIAGKEKFNKAKRTLEVSLALNGRQLNSLSDSEQLAGIMKHGILATYRVVKALDIRDFDVDAFYRDAGTLLSNRDWMKDSAKYEHRQDMFTPSFFAASQGGSTFEFTIEPLWTPGHFGPILHQLAPISNYLAIELSAKQYGPAVARFLMLVWWRGTPGTESADTESRVNEMVSYLNAGSKRYDESRKGVIWDIELKDADVISSSEEQFVQALKRAIMGTKSAVKALNIEGFDIDAFYRDLEALLDGRGWTEDPDKYRWYRVRKGPFAGSTRERGGPSLSHDQRVARAILKKIKMPDGDFWHLIDESIKVAEGSIEKQLEYLESTLAARTRNDILGFELTLRYLISQSYHHNVAALLKIIDGAVTDDGLLYFRCRLILYGQDAFYKAIRNPNKLTERLCDDPNAELLLSVSDRAVVQQSGGTTHEDLPSEVGATLFDYNTEGGPLLGTPWTERTFAKRYAALLKLYK